MTYSINKIGSIIRDFDGATIPADPMNTDYAAYVVWTKAGNVATPPVVDLVALKASVKNSIREFRDNLLLLTPFNGKVFQSDIASKIQIMVVSGQTTMIPSASSWRTADNSYATMTLALFQQLMGTIMTREGAAYANSSKHQDAVDALTKAADVSAYNWTTGWPA